MVISAAYRPEVSPPTQKIDATTLSRFPRKLRHPAANEEWLIAVIAIPLVAPAGDDVRCTQVNITQNQWLVAELEEIARKTDLRGRTPPKSADAVDRVRTNGEAGVSRRI